jgi:hypothetical protein
MLRPFGHVLAAIGLGALSVACFYWSAGADRSGNSQLADRLMSFKWVRSQEDMVDRLRIARVALGVIALVIAIVLLATA